MASSDLMFTPAGDLAARVRGGELSARELVQASLDRIGALDGEDAPHPLHVVGLEAEVHLLVEGPGEVLGQGERRPDRGLGDALQEARDNAEGQAALAQALAFQAACSSEAPTPDTSRAVGAHSLKPVASAAMVTPRSSIEPASSIRSRSSGTSIRRRRR